MSTENGTLCSPDVVPDITHVHDNTFIHQHVKKEGEKKDTSTKSLGWKELQEGEDAQQYQRIASYFERYPFIEIMKNQNIPNAIQKINLPSDQIMESSLSNWDILNNEYQKVIIMYNEALALFAEIIKTAKPNLTIAKLPPKQRSKPISLEPFAIENILQLSPERLSRLHEKLEEEGDRYRIWRNPKDRFYDLHHLTNRIATLQECILQLTQARKNLL